MSNAKQPPALVKSDEFQGNQEATLQGLRALSGSLRELDSTSPLALTHYRNLPETVTHSRELLQTGATLIHGTSTKYTLLGKIDQKEQIKMTQDLMKGCQFIATGCVLVHEPSLGCSRAFRRHVKQACRAIIETVVQLIGSFSDETALEENVGAQKTGVVWQACNVILEKQLPIGNRNAIRRDLFTYMMECQETMEEFQGLIDMGPTLKEEEDTGDDQKLAPDYARQQSDASGDSGWQNFLEGKDQQYSSQEVSVATACLTLVKCSRGSINLSLQACEAVGAQTTEGSSAADATDQPTPLSAEDKARLEWLERLYRLACVVGDGMTDFATNLYPPLDLAVLPQQIEQQSTNAIAPLVDMVVDATLSDGTTMELPQEVVELATKLKVAVGKRRNEALEAVAKAAG